MNLTKMFVTQKVLRDRFNYDEPDRFNKLVLALLVEVGECANEWRGFKFWSKNQEPSKSIHTTDGATLENASFFKCMSDECGDVLHKKDFKNLFEPDYETCPHCKEDYVYPFREKEPLLEEYVDGLHFILELCIELGMEVEQLQNFIGDHKKKINSMESHFGYVYHKASELMDTGSIQEKAYKMLHIANAYLGLGYRLGFTWEQIEAAYFEKNKINHDRQDNGY